MAKTVKPTPEEKRVIDARLRKQYPQMYAPGASKLYTTPPKFGSRVKMAIGKAIGKKKKKPFETTRAKDITKQLKNAGISDEEIKKLKGKKK